MKHYCTTVNTAKLHNYVIPVSFYRYVLVLRIVAYAVLNTVTIYRYLIFRLRVEGKVVQRAECCPIQTKTYENIKRQAITMAGEPVSHSIFTSFHVVFSFFEL
jgi:hypothetical protein